jgi:4-hydroxy-tetrahydrodipicolinate synthase
MSRFRPEGVIPAALMPFTETLAIDEPQYRKHLEDIADVEGISGITINGHAAEVHALTIEEQHRAIVVTREVLQDRTATIVGIFTNSSLEAARLAAFAEREGADALLVFPPEVMVMGGHLRPEMIHEHLRRITDASSLPIILFQYPLISNLGYPLKTLISLCEAFPQIRAIKDQCGDGNLHERQIRELKALDRPVNTLTTHSAWLLGSLAMGCDGLLSGAGSTIAPLQVALFRAVKSGNLAEARAINDRIYPTVRAFYDAPLLDMHNRMKVAQVLMGRLKASHVRPPLVAPAQDEVEKIGRLLVEAGLLAQLPHRKSA